MMKKPFYKSIRLLPLLFLLFLVCSNDFCASWTQTGLYESVLTTQSPLKSHFSHQIQTRGSTKQHFCGEVLISALALICKGNYNRKRANNNDEEESQPQQSQQQQDYYYKSDDFDWPSSNHFYQKQTELNENNQWPLNFFQVFRNAGQFANENAKNSHYQKPETELWQSGIKPAWWILGKKMDAKIRLKRGVVDECCKRPCTPSTLSQYCKSS